MKPVRSLRKSSHVPVPVSRLRPGSVLRNPMLEDHSRSTTLLPPGSVLTAERLETLVARGVERVRVHRSEVADLTADVREESVALQRARDRAESVGEREGDSPWAVNADSLVHHVRLHGTTPYDPVTHEAFTAQFDGSVETVETAFTALFEGVAPDAEGLHNVTRESVLQLTQDIDLFVALGIEPVTSGYPSKHSVQTAMVAMSIGTRLGLRRGELLELGIGCLVHDAGMLHVDQSLVRSEERLDRIGFLEITKHPIITFDLLQKVDAVPRGALMVAYQMHERCDGSGYPRGRRGRQIHPLARIAAVADVYVALVSPRPHRPGLPPYEAVVQLLEQVRARKLDRHAVRGLLRTVSLFPVGSCVELLDGRRGRVLRTTSDYTRPIVQLADGHGPDGMLDLSSTDLRITRAVDEWDLVEAIPTDPLETLVAFWD